MKYKYKNKETNEIISFETNSLYTFIYGPNGSGKTTFSKEYYERKIDNTIYKVFNEDFVNNNVYVTELDGSKQSADNKKGLNKLFIGNNVKKYSDFLTRVRSRKNQINSIAINNDFQKINEKFVENIDKIFGEDEEYRKNREPFIMHILKPDNIANTIEKIKNQINIDGITISTKNILNDKFTKKYEYDYKYEIDYELIKQEVIKKLKEKNQMQLEEYNKSIDEFQKKINLQMNDLSTNLLKNVMDYKKELDGEIKKYEIIKSIDEKNEKFINEVIEGQDFTTSAIKQWQEDGYKFHKAIDFEKCLYCHNDTFEEEVVEDYKTIYDNKYSKLLIGLKQNVDKYIIPLINNEGQFTILNKFYEKSERMDEQKIIQELYINIKNVNRIITDIYEKKIFKDELIDSIEIVSKLYNEKRKIFDNIEEKGEESDNNEVQIDETIKLLYSDEAVLRGIKKEIFLKNLSRIEIELKNRINEIQANEVKKVEDYLKFYQKIFNTKYDIENVKSTVSPGQDANAMLEIRFNNRRRINEISTGEKNILALIIFFSNVEYELKKLKDGEKVTIILDDPVNSNDWNIFFSLQAIVEDYFQHLYRDKIGEIIILSHNVDYAVVQLQNLKAKKEKIRLYRLFPNKCINIDIELMYTNDIKLISNFIYEWISSFEKNENIYYMGKEKSYRVFLSYRKFLEDIIYERSQISKINIDDKEKDDIEKLKDISNNQEIIELLEFSSQILYHTEDSKVDLTTFSKKFLSIIKKIIKEENILKLEKSDFIKIIDKIELGENIKFKIKDIEECDTIRVDDFEIDNNDIDQEKMKNILVKAFTIKRDKRDTDEIKFMNNQSKIYYINYLKHSNELVGKPLLALDVEPMIEYLNKEKIINEK